MTVSDDLYSELDDDERRGEEEWIEHLSTARGNPNELADEKRQQHEGEADHHVLEDTVKAAQVEPRDVRVRHRTARAVPHLWIERRPRAVEEDEHEAVAEGEHVRERNPRTVQARAEPAARVGEDEVGDQRGRDPGGRPSDRHREP